MGRPRIDESLADRYGTLHSITVHPTDKDTYRARARVCYLSPEGEWKWVARCLDGPTPEAARADLIERVTGVIGCRTQDEMNHITGGLHRGHQHVPAGALPQG
ncbi:hypothetical protein [Microbacterium sp. T2.11-28]|uniref:hypothetical protein n=1 Tax=Microbacterium sp. T2.11-28 TaxID=3041169 RepID=UPI0024774ADE|nr:hypothetical protein [Microbacterium sp. T2.11-28]CAI9386520.1 hypothetical protein MICABA_00440 [Microbacterium sp. T2.11-28]